ncbi:MAG: PAS domain S-box protein [Chloroflexi bacterium]|nr:MAG: PAS domain S-box protein [Chloroflexota bacterium]
MPALKEFANFLTLNLANLAETYAQLLAQSNTDYADIAPHHRIASGRKLLKATSESCRQQSSAPLINLFRANALRWPSDVTPAGPAVEIECLGQTINPVITNLDAGKFLWQALSDVRAEIAKHQQAEALAAQAARTFSGGDGPVQEQTLLRILINNLPDYIYIKDIHSRFLLVNDMQRRHLGAPTIDDVIGKTDFDFSPPELAEQYFKDEQQLFKSGQALVSKEETIFNHQTNSLQWVITTKAVFYDDEGNVAGLVGLSRDITQQKQNEEKLAKLANELETGIEVSTAISTILDVDKLLQTVADLTKERFNLYHAHIYTFNEDTNLLELAAGAGEIGRKMLQQGWSIPFQQELSLVARAARLQKPVVANDVFSTTGFFPNPLLPNTRAELAVPVATGRRLLGVLDVQADVTDYFSPEDERIYAALASQIAAALRNARLYSQMQAALADVQHSQELLRTVIDATPDWIFIKDLKHRYQLVNKSYAESMNLSAEEIIGKNDLELGFSEEDVRGNPETGKIGFWMHDDSVIRSGKPELVESAPAVVNGKHVFFNTLKAPLKRENGEIWGLLGYVRDVTEREELFANTESLYKASAELNVADSYDSVLSVLQKYSRLGQQAYTISLGYFDHPWTEERQPAGVNMLARWSAEPAGAFSPYYRLKDFPAADRLLRRDEPVVIEDISADPRMDEQTRITYLERFKVKSTLFAPLVVAGNWVGYVNMTFKEKITANPADVRRLVSLIGQASVVVQSIQRLAKTEQQAQREQTIREITEKMRTATSLEQLVQLTAQELGQRFSAEYALVELGVETQTNNDS